MRSLHFIGGGLLVISMAFCICFAGYMHEKTLSTIETKPQSSQTIIKYIDRPVEKIVYKDKEVVKYVPNSGTSALPPEPIDNFIDQWNGSRYAQIEAPVQ